MTRSTRWQLVFLVAVSVIVIAAALYVNRNNSRIDRLAMAAYVEARQALPPKQTTADAAREWLEARGWFIAHNPSGHWLAARYKEDAGPFDPPEYLMLRAYRQLGLDDRVPGARWISLQLRFTPEQRLESITLNSHARVPEGWRGKPQ